MRPHHYLAYCAQGGLAPGGVPIVLRQIDMEAANENRLLFAAEHR